MATQTLNAPIAVDSRAFVPGPAAITGAVIALAAWYLSITISWRQAALFLVGAGAGVVLYHAAFGFTSSWRQFIADRRGGGLRAQMLMLAITCAVFFPLLASGTLFGQPIRGSVSPAGVSVIAGAFIFGVGMQLGGGCASGTLFAVGGGNTRMIVTLLMFIVGSLIGTAHTGWWNATPAIPATSIVTVLGPWAGLAASFALFGGIVMLTRRAERQPPRRHPRRSRGVEAPLASRTLAAGRWRHRTGGREHRDSRHRRAAVGSHLRLCAVGRQGVHRHGRRRVVLVVLDGAGTGHGPQVERLVGCDLGDGLRNPSWAR